MPESEPPTEAAGPAGSSDGELPEEELGQLEETVDRLLQRLESLRRRAREAEAAHEDLRRALSGSGGGDGGPEGNGAEAVGERLRRLSRENERLRDLLDEGRERAERIRKRLVLLEDES